MRPHPLSLLIAVLALAAPPAAVAQIKVQKAAPVQMVAPPQIDGALSMPGFATTYPGARVYLKGNGFHQGPGTIAMYGKVGGQEKTVALQDVEWKSDGKANGVVPMAALDFSGDHPVYFQVIRKGQSSNRQRMAFQPILLAQIEESPQQLADPLEPHEQQMADPIVHEQQMADPQQNTLVMAGIEPADEDEDLSDWNPYGTDGGVPAVRVTKPVYNAALPPTQGGVVLQVTHQGGVAPPRLLVEFARLTEAPDSIGDIKLPGGHSHMWQTTHSYERAFTQDPMPLNFHGPIFRGQEGQYRVRVRGKASKAMGGWSAWKPFCVGSAQACKPTGQLTKSPAALNAASKASVQGDANTLRRGVAPATTPKSAPTAPATKARSGALRRVR